MMAAVIRALPASAFLGSETAVSMVNPPMMSMPNKMMPAPVRR